MNLINLIIANAYAQVNPPGRDLIPCQDGTFADPTIGCTDTPAAIVNAQSDLLSVILKAADAVVSFAVIGAIIALIYGGIIYSMSMGNKDKIQKAKNILFWSVFGLLVALLAKYIVTAVLAIITQ